MIFRLMDQKGSFMLEFTFTLITSINCHQKQMQQIIRWLICEKLEVIYLKRSGSLCNANGFGIDSSSVFVRLVIVTSCIVSICDRWSSNVGKMSEHVSQVNLLLCSVSCFFMWWLIARRLPQVFKHKRHLFQTNKQIINETFSCRKFPMGNLYGIPEYVWIDMPIEMID